MVAQSIIEPGAFSVIVGHIEWLGWALASWIQQTIRHDTVLIGSVLTGLIVMLKLLRVR